MSTSPPIALTIAGSDCCAGAGIQTDLKTFAAHDVYGLSAVTAIVSEIPGKVASIQGVSDELVESQVQILLQNYPIKAIKTGMLYSTSRVQAIVDHLTNFEGPIVVDPVLVASSGDALGREDLIEFLKSKLFPLARLLTPNLDEIESLTSRKISNLVELSDAAKELSKQYGCATLAKGGHLNSGEQCTDILVDGEDVFRFEVPRLHGVSTHGTGCTLASAITARLAKGEGLETACRDAQKWLHCAMKDRHRWSSKLEALKTF